MRTTLNIDDSLMESLLQLSNEKSKTRAVTLAIKDYLHRKKLEKILTYQNNLEIDDNWKTLEEDELKEYDHE